MGEQVPTPADLWATGKKREHDDVKQMTLTLSPLVEVVDLFCGGGGFTAGALMAGAKVVLAVDNWNPALTIHEANHPNVPTACFDLGGSIPDTAVFIRERLTRGSHFHLHGSPPCQALSTASNRDGDEGMVLVNWFLDLVDYMKPDSWSMENVVPVGKRLRESRPDVPFVKLNAADFGVPQTRQRIFAGEGWKAEPTHEKEDWVSVIEALPDLEGELRMTVNANIRQRGVDEPMRTITSKTPSQTRIVSRRRKKGEEPQSYPPSNPAHTITRLPHIAERTIMSNTDGCGASTSRRACSVDTPLDQPVKTIHNNAVSIREYVFHMDSGRSSAKTCGVNPKTGKKEGGSGFLSRPLEQPSYTITSSVKNLVEVKPTIQRIRSLTLHESAILQGFPADVKLPYEKKKDAWVVVGNAVCPPVAAAIIRGLF